MPSAAASRIGYIHSVDTCGTVDGPGIRFVVFTTGCPLRCLYCHNPDTAKLVDGKQRTVDDLLNEIGTYHEFLRKAKGGLTVSGGEPLVQSKFVRALFKGVKERYNMHTTLDTSGHGGLKSANRVLPHTDLVMLDIKSWDRETYKKVTAKKIDKCLAFAELLQEQNKPTWIRYVLVPGLTDDEQNMEGLSEYLKPMSNIERIEILPFHKMGEYKWAELGYEYQLKAVEPPTKAGIDVAKAIFEKSGHLVIA